MKFWFGDEPENSIAYPEAQYDQQPNKGSFHFSVCKAQDTSSGAYIHVPTYTSPWSEVDMHQLINCST